MYNGSTRSGQFIPKRPEKYVGKTPIIIYRSSWERDVMEFCDNNLRVLRWSYEDIEIPYLKPLQNGNMKRARYYPDIYVEYIDSSGKLQKELIEIKPKKQTMLSKSRKSDTKMQENYTYIVNQAKWHAAEMWCKKEGIHFRILTEGSIFK